MKIIDYLLLFRDLQIALTNDSANSKVVVIIEPRYDHPMLPHVIKNVMFHLGPEWNLRVFTSQRGKATLTATWKWLNVDIVALPFDNLTHTLYNQLLMSLSFWESIPEEHILIFQTDCILFRGIDNKWLEYAYVGANYYNTANTAPHIGGIQGGLSMRNKTAMIKCIEQVPKNYIDEYRHFYGLRATKKDNDMHEDVYFSHACEILNLHVPSVSERKHFAVEVDFFPMTCGFHGFQHPYFTEEQEEAYVKNAIFPPVDFPESL